MYDKANIFAKIIRGEIPCSKVYEDSKVLAFKDISPSAPVHILVVPKGEYVSFDDFAARTTPQELSAFFKTVQKIAHEQGVAASGYRLITNHGIHASQTVPHFHVHLLAGRPLGGLVQGDKLNR